ncbi:hypothetical protein DCAR_0415584 [Daucus carota subsp. sativus]|uniref:DUF4283 domain-containing protein n=1 Tax=Daucus carota subsp. sativus TaxID=79200 RepID=A0AAF0WYG7_DAUCS|nr:hypothetical protein DCAR_0415584 [Daucus carota subsp. sativus]
MTESNTAVKEMEDSFALIRIEDEEERGLQYEEQDGVQAEIDMRWCLVGRFSIDSPIDFQAMQHNGSAMRPGRGVYVKELQPNRYIFQFYPEVDIKWVIEGSSWTFGRSHLVFERLKDDDNPRTLSLNNMLIWRVIQNIENYIGQFVKSDPNNFIGVWRD